MSGRSGRGRSVAVVGAGQAGTTLAIGLLDRGFRVTLVSDRTAAEVRAGTVMSSQITFSSALAVEDSLGITPLLPPAPPIGAFSYESRRGDGSTAGFLAELPAPARSIDQRLRVSTLLEEVERRGGTVLVRSADVRDVEDLAREHDLVVISTGRGGLTSLFEVDAARSPYFEPQRVAALTYLRRRETADRGGIEGPGVLRYTSVEGVGECFTCPGVTTSGACEIVVVEGVPGGPLDRWADVSTADDHLARLQDLLREVFPSQARRLSGASLTDAHGVLRGQITPVVRRPVGRLPSGAPVLGMADVLVLNDPLTSQGANNAVKSAALYLDAIASCDGAFDAEWMQRTFDAYWRGWAQWATAWTNSLLRPLRDHQRRILDSAARTPGIARCFATGFDDARTFSPWWFDAVQAQTFVAEAEAREQHAALDPVDLRRALGQYATGVTVVTTADAEGRRWGMTANSFTSVSLNPPLVLFAAAKRSASLPAFLSATHFAVNVLAAHQHHLSRQFSTTGGDKFQGLVQVSPDQVADTAAEQESAAPPVRPPVLEGTVASFLCRTTQQVDAGDHVVILGEVESYEAPGGEPLVFHSGSYRLTTKHPDL